MLFTLVSFAVFFQSLWRGQGLEMARTIVVNTLVVMEIFYLFNVRFMHMASITWRGVLGTPAVLIALAAVVAGQFAFTYLPVMQQIFDTRPVAFLDGVMIVAIGAGLLVVLELEKALLRRLRLFDASQM